MHYIEDTYEQARRCQVCAQGLTSYNTVDEVAACIDSKDATVGLGANRPGKYSIKKATPEPQKY